jgi:hypothetical protein
VAVSPAGHSTLILQLRSTVFTFTGTEKRYISQSHVTCLPASNLSLPLLNQNFDVIAGSTKASKTSGQFANQHLGFGDWRSFCFGGWRWRVLLRDRSASLGLNFRMIQPAVFLFGLYFLHFHFGFLSFEFLD